MSKSPRNIIGKRFGRLLVIGKAEPVSFIEISKEGGTKIKMRASWLCRCDCGNEKRVVSLYLQRGSTKSCGCLLTEFCTNKWLNSGFRGDVGAFRMLYGRYKEGAKRNGREFALSKARFRVITKQNCYYCNKPPYQVIKKRPCKNNEANTKDYVYNGIDRMDNNKGYIEGNCAPCCEVCNKMKSMLSENDFLKHIESIFNNLKSKMT